MRDIYDSSIHHAIKGPVPPALWRSYEIGDNGRAEIYTLGDTLITKETRFVGSERRPSFRFEVDGGTLKDKLSAANWLAESIARDKDRYRISQPGTQVFPDRVVFKSGTYLEDATEGGGESYGRK